MPTGRQMNSTAHSAYRIPLAVLAGRWLRFQSNCALGAQSMLNAVVITMQQMSFNLQSDLMPLRPGTPARRPFSSDSYYLRIGFAMIPSKLLAGVVAWYRRRVRLIAGHYIHSARCIYCMYAVGWFPGSVTGRSVARYTMMFTLPVYPCLHAGWS